MRPNLRPACRCCVVLACRTHFENPPSRSFLKPVVRGGVRYMGANAIRCRRWGSPLDA